MGLYDSQPMAGALGGAGTGAAIGSVVPGIGTGIGAALGFAGGLLNSIIGAKSQSAANALNARIARETNAQNYQMFQEQQKFAWDMWKSTNKWNAPANQRNLMQEAGYNPNMIFGYNGSSAQNISSPTPNGAQTGAPMQATYNPAYMDNAINTGVNSMVALSEARLKDAQAAGQRIDNLYSARNKEADLLLKHDTHTATAIQNEVDSATKDDKKKAVELQNKKTEADTIKSLSDSALNQVLEKYHNVKVDEVKESIKVLVEQRDVMKAQKFMQNALGSKYLAEKALAEVQKALAPAIAASQIESNYASAAQSFSQADLNEKIREYQHMLNQTYAMFGDGKAAQEFLNTVKDGNIKTFESWNLYQDGKSKGIFNDYEDMHKWLRNAQQLIEFIQSLAKFAPMPPGM